MPPLTIYLSMGISDGVAHLAPRTPVTLAECFCLWAEAHSSASQSEWGWGWGSGGKERVVKERTGKERKGSDGED